MSITLFILLAFSATSAQEATTSTDEVLTNESVVTMIKVGLSPSVVISKIRTSRTNFDTSTSELARLQDAGIPAKIINAMVEAKSANSPVPSLTGVAEISRTDPNQPPAADDDSYPYRSDELDSKAKVPQLEPSVASQREDANDLIPTLRASRARVTKMEVESPKSHDVVNVSNPAGAPADIDFVAIDEQGNEAGRETVVIGPGEETTLNLQNIFPNLRFGELSTIEIQSSIRPTEIRLAGKREVGGHGDLTAAKAQLAVAFFSQRDSRWANNRLGSCAGTTIGSAGCAITAVAMAGARSVYNWNPATVNTYLTKNAGYASGCLVKWAAPANVDGTSGLTYLGSGTVGSATNLRSIIDGNKFAVVKSYRFSSHFAIIIGYNNTGSKLSDFYYLDPWDRTATFRLVGDGWVTATSTTQIYR
jgi:hypothetical protein